MEKLHATPHGLGRGTPLWFTASGWSVPVGVLAQFFSAGHALFGGADFAAHAAIGSLIALPVLTLFLGSILIRHLRSLGWWAGILTILLILQFAMAGGDAKPFLAYHPFNGGLLLVASVILLGKLERLRGFGRPMEPER